MAGLDVKEWNSVAQIMALTWLLGLDGFFHVLEELLVEMSVDISRLKLLLSGDVEQNPGPMQVCMMVGPVFVVLIIQGNFRVIETGQVLTKYGMMHNNPWYLISSLPFHCNYVYCLHRRQFCMTH